MISMNRKLSLCLKILTVVVLVGAAIWLFVVNNSNNREYKELENKKKSIHIAKKDKFHDSLDASEVKKYKQLLDDKFKGYLNYDLPEGVMNTDNTGIQAIKSKVSPNGGKIFDKHSSKKEFIEYYSDLDYKISQVAAQKDGKGNVEVMALVDTKFKGRKIADNYRLISITFDSDNKIIGGSIYGEQ